MNMKSLIRKYHLQIHIITNYITAEVSVNAVLAVGATAIGADSPLEVSEITSSSDALVLNTGTPSIERYEAIRLAGITANTKNIPVVLDPVGVGASSFRKENIVKLLSDICFTCIRGNASEIMSLCALMGGEIVMPSSGVEDAGQGFDKNAVIALSKKLGAIIVISGETVTLVSARDDFYKEFPGGST